VINPISPPDADRSSGAIPSRDALYVVLSARRRREALRQLNAVGEGITLADLAERIAFEDTATETDEDAGSGSTADARRVHLSLHHVHVPKLAAANAVEFDRAERTVTLTETGRAIAAGLERRADRDR
jgi:hypothetical protein